MVNEPDPPCAGAECPTPPVLIDPACDDEVTNGDETDTDCGGSCGPCAAGESCGGDNDCAEGAFCRTPPGVCTVATCSDGVQNGAERGEDCGGGDCGGCPSGTPCETPEDCESGVCGVGGRCAEPSCNDRVHNGAEGGVDCGGPCLLRCSVGSSCAAPADCGSGVCLSEGCPAGIALCCQAPSCSDGVANAGEPVPDCGNAACGPCRNGQSCTDDEQCESGFCPAGTCADAGSCNDNVQNGRESSTDCGGNRCGVCPDLSRCNSDADCFNQNCDPNGICISCGDATLNGTETDEDCGGDDPFCRRCNPGEACRINSDCITGVCFNGFC